MFHHPVHTPASPQPAAQSTQKAGKGVSAAAPVWKNNPSIVLQGYFIIQAKETAPFTPSAHQQQNVPVVQRAAGFEMQTTMPVRSPTGEPYGYKTELFTDNRLDPAQADNPFFALTVDSDSVLVPQQAEPQKMEVLEFVIPPVSSEATIADTGARLEHMRSALNDVTQGATRAATLQNVVTRYEQLLLATYTEGQDMYESQDRASGTRHPGAIIGLDNGNWHDHMSVRPQVTFGVDLQQLSTTLTSLLNSPVLVKNNQYRQQLIDLIIGVGQGMPEGRLKGLLTLVQLYLATMGSSVRYDYAKDATPFMARTDFHSMYNTLPPHEQGQWPEVVNNIAPEYGEKVFNGGLPSMQGGPEGTGRYKGPDKKAWLQSIADPRSVPEEIRIQYTQEAIAERLLIIDANLNSDEAISAFLHTLNDNHPAKNNAISALQKISGYEKPIKEETDAIIAIYNEADGNPKQALGAWWKLKKSKLLRQLFVPVPEEMMALCTFCQQENKIEDVIAAYTTATHQNLTHPTKDMMSSGFIADQVSSMGSMTVPAQGAEQHMAILENRIMPDWDAGNTFQEDIPWNDRLTIAFQALQEAINGVQLMDEGEYIQQ